MKRLDSNALYQALKRKREDRGITWADIATETGVSSSTVRRTREGGRMEVDGMIAMVDWLGETVETFVKESRN